MTDYRLTQHFINIEHHYPLFLIANQDQEIRGTQHSYVSRSLWDWMIILLIMFEIDD
jgi:hypothetical protein